MTSSFCHVFLLCAEIDPNPSYQHRKWNYVKVSVFRLERPFYFFFNLASSFGSNKKWTTTDKNVAYRNLSIGIDTPLWNIVPRWNSIILWGVGKINQHSKTHPKHLVKFWQNLMSFQRSLRVNRLIQTIWFPFFSLKRKKEKRMIFPWKYGFLNILQPLTFWHKHTSSTVC